MTVLTGKVDLLVFSEVKRGRKYANQLLKSRFQCKEHKFCLQHCETQKQKRSFLNSNFHILEELVSYFWQIRMHRYVSSNDILDTLMLYVAIISEFNAFIFEETIVAQFIYGKCITVAEAKDK